MYNTYNSYEYKCIRAYKDTTTYKTTQLVLSYLK